MAGATPDYATGQDLTNSEIVRNFLEQGGQAQLVAATREFSVTQGKTSTKMLGTYSPVGNLDWAVIVQKPRDEAYRGVYEMQRSARLLALLAILLSVGISIFAARRITNPLEDSHRIQPRHRPRRLLAAGQTQKPHRDRGTGRNFQHHV